MPCVSLPDSLELVPVRSILGDLLCPEMIIWVRSILNFIQRCGLVTEKKSRVDIRVIRVARP